MKSKDENISKDLLIEDLKISFSMFIEKKDPKEINTIWQLLQHAKQKKWFDKDFYEYWLIKILTTTYGDAAFVLCLPIVSQEICEFNEKTLGEFLMPKIDFLIKISEFEKATNWIIYALEGNVFFEKAWFKNTINYLGIENQEKFLGMNNQNDAFFLNKILN